MLSRDLIPTKEQEGRQWRNGDPYLLVNRPHCNKMSLKTYKAHKRFILIKLPRNNGKPLISFHWMFIHHQILIKRF